MPEPDKNLTPGQVPDPLAVYLAAAGERWDAAGNGTWEDYPTALELLSSALRSAADVPRLLGAVEAAREIHRPFAIYAECSHQHLDPRDATSVNAGDFLTCPDSFLYEVCAECCTGRSAPFGQTEDCTDEHDHGDGKPICPTHEAITAELTGKDGTDGN